MHVRTDGRLDVSGTGLDRLDGGAVFPVGMQRYPAYSTTFENPWRVCAAPASTEHFDCTVPTSGQTPGQLAHTGAGQLSSTSQNPCVPAYLWHAEIAQELEPRLGDEGPFNVAIKNNFNQYFAGGGEWRATDEKYPWNLNRSADPRCTLYDGNAPVFEPGADPFDTPNFDPSSEYCGIGTGSSNCPCAATSTCVIDHTEIQMLSVLALSHRTDGKNPASSTSGSDKYAWLYDGYKEMCAVPYRVRVCRSPGLATSVLPPPLGPTCDQCMFSDWSNPEACQACLVLADGTAPSNQPPGTPPFITQADCENSLSATSYPITDLEEHWLSDAPASVIDCPALAADEAAGTFAPFPNSDGCTDCADTDCDDNPHCTAQAACDGVPQNQCLGGPCPSWAADPFQYRYWRRPECPLNTVSEPNFTPTLVAAGTDPEGARLANAGPFTDPFDDFYPWTWNDGTGSSGIAPICMNEPVPGFFTTDTPAQCFVEIMSDLPYPNGHLDTLIGFVEPDELPNVRGGSASFTPWLDASCLDTDPADTLGRPFWQTNAFCQGSGRVLPYSHNATATATAQRDALPTSRERAELLEHLESAQAEKPGFLSFYQHGDVLSLRDLVTPRTDVPGSTSGETEAPVNGLLPHIYPVKRLGGAHGTNGVVGGIGYTLAYFTPMTKMRDTARALSDAADAASDGGKTNWWTLLASGEGDCYNGRLPQGNSLYTPSTPAVELPKGCPNYWANPGDGDVDGDGDSDASYANARPTLEQLRVEAWTAIAEGADGITFYPDGRAGDFGIDDPTLGLAAMANEGRSEARSDNPTLTLGAHVLEVAAELKVYSPAFTGRLLEHDVTVERLGLPEADPYEAEAPWGPFGFSSGPPGRPSGLMHVPVAGVPTDPMTPALLPLGTTDDLGRFIDSDGDQLVDEPRKQDASGAVFEGFAGLRHLVVTNLKECRRYVAISPPVAGMPSPPPALLSLIDLVNIEDSTVSWYAPCEGNIEITDPAQPHENNYFFGPDGEWWKWQGAGGVFKGVAQEVEVTSSHLEDRMITCASLVSEDDPFAGGADLWAMGSAWFTKAVQPVMPGIIGVDFAMEPYDVVVCTQRGSSPFRYNDHWLDTLPPAARHSGWTPVQWMLADPTVGGDPAEAEIAPMCALPGGGVGPCAGSMWEAHHTESAPLLCTNCSDPHGVEDAADDWTFLLNHASGYPQFNFERVTDGKLCLALEYVLEPGYDDDGSAIHWDRASVEIASADGCQVLGHGADSSCPPLDLDEVWARSDGVPPGMHHDAVDLSAYLGMPFSVGMRYEASDDHHRTAGHGWEVWKADLAWFSDAEAGTSSCQDLVYGP